MEDSERTFIFQTIYACRNEACKQIIDGDNNMNIMSEVIFPRLKLPNETHPQLDLTHFLIATNKLRSNIETM